MLDQLQGALKCFHHQLIFHCAISYILQYVLIKKNLCNLDIRGKYLNNLCGTFSLPLLYLYFGYLHLETCHMMHVPSKILHNHIYKHEHPHNPNLIPSTLFLQYTQMQVYLSPQDMLPLTTQVTYKETYHLFKTFMCINLTIKFGDDILAP